MSQPQPSLRQSPGIPKMTVRNKPPNMLQVSQQTVLIFISFSLGMEYLNNCSFIDLELVIIFFILLSHVLVLNLFKLHVHKFRATLDSQDLKFLSLYFYKSTFYFKCYFVYHMYIFCTCISLNTDLEAGDTLHHVMNDS